MNFNESSAYLLSLGNEVLAMKFGLEATEKILVALGSPEKKYLKIQVAGTNGKGSTCAFLDAICRCANIKTGLYTSPHLLSITERIRINGRQISEWKFARHATKVKNVSEALVEKSELETVPTFFEQMTAIAVSVFAEAKIELAILETGLGGRFDSVTATRAEIAVITPIDYDHQQFLGDSLTEIAAEKAAIIRSDTRVVVAMQKKEAGRVIEGKCREVAVTPIQATTNIKVKKHYLLSNESLPAVNFVTEAGSYSDVVLSLRGAHQHCNAATAIAVAERLLEFDFKITDDNIRNGLETAEHKGRLEYFQGILFDGAHNVAGAEALKIYLDEFIEQPITMIFGSMRDKELLRIARILFPKADKLVLTKPDNPRSAEPSELLKLVPKNLLMENVFATETVASAIQKARQVSSEKHLILIAGSLNLVGEAQKNLDKKVRTGHTEQRRN